MNKLFKLMQLEGQLRISFVKQGIEEEKALELASEAFHILITSQIAKDEYRIEYEETLDNKTKK